MQINYLWIALAFMLGCTGSYFAGNYYGHKNERNSQENMQRISIIKNQNIAIDKLQKDAQIKDQAVKDLQAKNNILQTNINTIQKEILRDQDIINKYNRIDATFLRPIYKASGSTAMSKNATTPGGTDGDTAKYRASEVDSAIVEALGKCQMIRNQLIELQKSIISQTENFNK